MRIRILISGPAYHVHADPDPDFYWGWGDVELCCIPYSAGVLQSVSDQNSEPTKLLHLPKQKWPVKTTLKDLCVEGLNCKSPIPKCRLFLKIDLLTDIVALCLTDFIDWRYIHSLVVILTQLVNRFPHGRRNYTCVLSSLWPPPLPKLNVQFTQAVCVWGGGGELCCVDHILQEFYTLFLTRCRTFQITSPPQTKWPVKKQH